MDLASAALLDIGNSLAAVGLPRHPAELIGRKICIQVCYSLEDDAPYNNVQKRVGLDRFLKGDATDHLENRENRNHEFYSLRLVTCYATITDLRREYASSLNELVVGIQPLQITGCSGPLNTIEYDLNNLADAPCLWSGCGANLPCRVTLL